MVEYPDRRVWRLDGHEVTRLLVDYAFTIVIWWRSQKSDNSVTIVLERPFILKRVEQVKHFTPEQKDTLGPALNILHQPIESLTAFCNGRLVLRFTDTSELITEKDDSYESWNTFGSGEFAQIGMLCSPHDGPPWKK
jgi:Family of unknown function (DUF6188)